ncbi:MAG: TIGR03089 family protein [Jatrophihabitans sp.]
MHLLTPEQRFAELLATDASHPFVSYYDEASGERSELSVKSLANWVAKTHFLLVDELGLGVGDTALVALPAHWISVPVLLGCLAAGLALTPEGSADVAFVSPQTLGAAAGVADRYVIAPESASVGLRDAVPDGGIDYVAAVRPQADAWASVQLRAQADDPCLPGLTRGATMERAAARATEVGLAAGGRLLSAQPWATPDDWLEAVLAPLAVGGSTVLVHNCSDESVLTRRAEQERTTARL